MSRSSQTSGPFPSTRFVLWCAAIVAGCAMTLAALVWPASAESPRPAVFSPTMSFAVYRRLPSETLPPIIVVPDEQSADAPYSGPQPVEPKFIPIPPWGMGQSATQLIPNYVAGSAQFLLVEQPDRADKHSVAQQSPAGPSLKRLRVPSRLP